MAHRRHRQRVFSGCQSASDADEGQNDQANALLLASQTEGTPEERAAAYAAVVELIHLATLVHDDAVDHSVLRRGMPTINSLFTHQVAVIAGDFLYSRAVQELVRLGDLEALRVFANASNELTSGRCGNSARSMPWRSPKTTTSS